MHRLLVHPEELDNLYSLTIDGISSFEGSIILLFNVFKMQPDLGQIFHQFVTIFFFFQQCAAAIEQTIRIACLTLINKIMETFITYSNKFDYI